MFQSITKDTVDLTEITPTTLKQVTISGDAKVSVFKLKTDGTYGTIYGWYGTLNGWSTDGKAVIEPGTVTFTAGEGFAMINNIKCTAAGVESTARTATASPIAMMVSGQVDLTCKNVVPSNYSISGNSSPVAIDLCSITPKTLLGVTISGDAKVSVFKLKTDGTYDTIYGWYGTLNGWSTDGKSVIEPDTVTFSAGEGFAMINNIKVTAAGVESTARTATASPIVLALPSPIK